MLQHLKYHLQGYFIFDTNIAEVSAEGLKINQVLNSEFYGPYTILMTEVKN
jgi:hypothetical protein